MPLDNAVQDKEVEKGQAMKNDRPDYSVSEATYESAEAARILNERLAPAPKSIKVRAASGFQPGLVIGLSPLRSSRGPRSSPTTGRGF